MTLTVLPVGAVAATGTAGVVGGAGAGAGGAGAGGGAGFFLPSFLVS